MKSLSLQEKEQKFVSTLLCCNHELIKNYDAKLKYHKNMVQLYESIVGNDNIEFEEIKQHNLIDFNEFRQNKFAYFNEVKKLVENFDINLTMQLNESIVSFTGNQGFSIEDFKKDLNNVITELSKNNDFDVLDTLSDTVRKIKIFSQKPIYVYGFDILNNQIFQKEIKEKFNIDTNDIYSILFDKSNKQLLFIFQGKIISYLLKTNELDYYNNIWNDTYQGNVKGIETIKFDNYFNFVCENINSNIIELYKNPQNFNPKFSDNLFKDNKKTAENAASLMYRKANLFFKS